MWLMQCTKLTHLYKFPRQSWNLCLNVQFFRKKSNQTRKQLSYQWLSVTQRTCWNHHPQVSANNSLKQSWNPKYHQPSFHEFKSYSCTLLLKTNNVSIRQKWRIKSNRHNPPRRIQISVPSPLATKLRGRGFPGIGHNQATKCPATFWNTAGKQIPTLSNLWQLSWT